MMTCNDRNRQDCDPASPDLHRLVFVSRSVVEGGVRERATALAEIVAASRKNNIAANLNSVITMHRGRFAQVIEGEAAAIDTVLDRIRTDNRHCDLEILQAGPTNGPCLPEHAMLLVGHEARSREPLLPILSHIGCEAVDGAALAKALAAAAAIAITTTNGERLAEQTSTASAPATSSISQSGCRADRIRGDFATLTSSPAVQASESISMEAECAALNAVFATACIDAEGRFLRVNATFASMLGYVPEELVGRTYPELLHPDDGGRLDRLWGALKRGEIVKVDRRALRRDGRERWLRSAYHPRIAVSGELRDIVEIATDVTDQQLRQADDRGQVAAIDRAQAVVHFDLDGTVLAVNDRFLVAMDYTRDAVVGRHHRMFVEASEADSAEYTALWTALAAGEHRTGEFRRIARDGSPVWLQATYNPIFDMGGRPFKIVKYATVVTEQKLRQADYQWQVAAIHKSHAVITFDMGGIILDANANFLEAAGYELTDVVGHHHRMFVEASYAHGSEYAAFWRELGLGRHQAGQYRRFGRGGREIWLQATYNPIFDMDGRPIRVVKYATVVTEEKLRQAEHQGQIAAIHAAQAVISFALDGTILDANDKFLDAMGYRLRDVRGRHHRMFVAGAEAGGAEYMTFWADLAQGMHKSGEFKRVARDGREVWLQATYNPIFDMNGRPFRIVEYAIDVTSEKLRQADIDGQITAINKSQGVVTFDLDGIILDVNPAFLDVLGYQGDELVGRHHCVLVESSYAASADYAEFWGVLRAGTFATGRYKRLGKGGREVWIQATYNPILDPDGRPIKVIKFATDVTADVSLAEAYEDAKRQAQHDAATALPNRVRLASYLAAALAHPSGRLVVLYLDLDRFKPINDTLGHAAGDTVLGEVADRLRRSLAPDQIAARVGGDEFVVVAPNLAEDAIEPFCQRLLEAVAQPVRHEGTELTVTASIGIAVSPVDGVSPDELLRAADTALYRSKQIGRGTFSFYAAAMNERVLAYRNQVEDLRRALLAEEFFLEYQPRFETHERGMQSVEALVRWKHPTRGRISPADFIPLAEKSGLIVPLGEWVLRAACRAAMAWPSLDVSVNVSPVQFRSSDVVGLVTAALAESGLDPHRLELEITEGVLLEDAERARVALEGLKRLGVRLAMDDFGTGYSSLSSLRTFPFDVIKIDRQFISDMDSREGGRAVVQAILGLGQALGLSVTAEGVETERQLRMLVEDACGEVQGYHLARPMAAHKIAALLAANEIITSQQLRSA